MKKTTYRGLSVLVLACALLALLPAAPARASSSTHMITWLSGSSSTVISPDKMVMTTTPTQNYLSEHVFNLNFSFTGNAAKGDVKIRLPAQIFVDRNGQSYGSVTVPLLLAPNEPTFGNRFNYCIDTATNEVDVTNTEPINGDFFLSVDIKYSGIKPDQIPMTFDQANNEYVYTKLFKAIMDVTTTDGNVESYTSNDLTMRYKTRADLNSLGKYLYGTYASWPGNLYGLGTPAPGSNPNDYFYVA